MAEKKPRKPRKDKGIKRGKRTKNPRLQTGSIDFRTIGTKETKGPNLTTLIGTLATLPRQVQPNLPQPYNAKEEEEKKKKEKEQLQQFISTELAKYAPRDLAKQNFPQPPQERPDMQQAQEEVLNYRSQVEDLSREVAAYKLQKVALTSNIRNTRKQAEKEKKRLEEELQDIENYGRIQQELQNKNIEELRQQSGNAAAELQRQSAETERLRQANILAEGDLRRQLEETEKLRKKAEEMKEDIVKQDETIRQLGNPPRILPNVLADLGIYQSASQEVEEPPSIPTSSPRARLMAARQFEEEQAENIPDEEDEPRTRNFPVEIQDKLDEDEFVDARGQTEARGQSQVRPPLPPRAPSQARTMPAITEFQPVAPPPMQVDLGAAAEVDFGGSPPSQPIGTRLKKTGAAEEKPKSKLLKRVEAAEGQGRKVSTISIEELKQIALGSNPRKAEIAKRELERRGTNV